MEFRRFISHVLIQCQFKNGTNEIFFVKETNELHKITIFWVKPFEFCRRFTDKKTTNQAPGRILKLRTLESIHYIRISLIFASASLDHEISRNFSVLSQLVRKTRQTEQIFRNFMVK